MKFCAILTKLIVEAYEKRFVPEAVVKNMVGGWSGGKIILKKHDASVGRFSLKPTVREESSPTVVSESALIKDSSVIAANSET